MRLLRTMAVVAVGLAWGTAVHAEDMVGRVKKAVERSTLNQPGTKPFHLRAELAPSREGDKDSGRTGQIEIWWQSPTRWRREVRCAEFHQLDIVNDGREWQKNEGDYFPEWVRNLAVELVQPVPPLTQVLERVRTADVKSLLGQEHAQWVTVGTDGTVSKGIGAGIALNDKDGLIFYGGERGWDGLFADYRDFHGRMVARKVSAGSPEVTAKVVVLEDLQAVPPDFFTTQQISGDAQLIQTVVVDELVLRKNLIVGPPVLWPTLESGPLEGVMISGIVVDRDGKVREVGTPVSDNPGLGEAAREWIAKQRFKPLVFNGAPVQVVSTLTLPFKTTRPAGVEAFGSARDYFELGRKAGFPTAAMGKPYVMRAEFDAKSSGGGVEKGRYEDTWSSDSQWRREAWLGTSHLVRSRNRDKRYLLTEGSDAELLKLVFRVVEPIPAIDTFVESDWRIKRETVNGVDAIRVLSGYESPDGKLDTQHARAYWFDQNGDLIKTYFSGFETRRADITGFGGLQIARRIDVLVSSGLAMRIRVTELAPKESIPPAGFDVKGHEWKRQFTAEVR